MGIYTGTAGNDTFTTGSGVDVAVGGAGDDVLSVGLGAGVLIGGSGADTLTGGSGSNFGEDWLLSANAPPDFEQVYYTGYLESHLSQLLDTGTEVDNLRSGSGVTRLFAGYGDNVDGSVGRGNYLYISFAGAATGVTVDFALPSQTIGGGVIKGIGIVKYVDGTRFDDNIRLRPVQPEFSYALSTIVGGEGNDTLTGDSSGNTLDGGPGNDVLDGGLNADTVTYASAPAGVNVSLALQGQAQNTGGGGSDTLRNIEVLIGSAYNDTLAGDGGNNLLVGGAGVDTVTFAAATGGVQVTLVTHAGGYAHGAGDDTLGDIENIVGSAFNDEFYGDFSSSVTNNSIDGGGGDDTFHNSSGLDTFTGGAGADHFIFGLIGVQPWELTLITDFEVGKDLIVPLALDQLDYAGSDPVADGYVSFASDGAGGTLILADRDGAGPLASTAIFDLAHVAPAALTWSQLTGIVGSTGGGGGGGGSSPQGQLLTGPSGGGAVQGGDGPDTLIGADNRNTLFGGDGADQIQGGANFNQVNGNKGEDTITGRSIVGDWLLGGQGDDRIDASASTGRNVLNGNLGNDTVTAGVGDDIVRGGQGNDVLRGGAGNDMMFGDRGDDVITGGAGADTFYFSAAGGQDRITDFTGAEGDRIHLDLGATYTLAEVGADTVLTLATGEKLTLAAVQSTSTSASWILVG